MNAAQDLQTHLEEIFAEELSSIPADDVTPERLAACLEHRKKSLIVHGIRWARFVSRNEMHRALRLQQHGAMLDVYKAPSWTQSGVHNHGESMGASVVIKGPFTELRFTNNEDGSNYSIDEDMLYAGRVSTMPAGTIHEIQNLTSEVAISIQLYVPWIGTYNRFSRKGGILVPSEPVEFQQA